MKNNRRGFEFSEQVKEEARRRWHAENPNNENAVLEVHHKCSVKHARELGLNPHEVNTLQNAQAMPVEEHRKVDHSDTEEMDGLLATMARFVGRLFN